jgi:hypothetical protein
MINWKLEEGLSFDQLKNKYSLTIKEVMALYIMWRANNVKD